MGEDEEYFDKHPVYDLRQIYAQDLLGNTLKKIAYAREIRDFPLWYGLLRWDLYADLYQKFDKEEIEKIDEQIKITKSIISKFPNAYLKRSVVAEEHEAITEAIWKLEILIKNIAEEHGVYGRAEEDIGL